MLARKPRPSVSLVCAIQSLVSAQFHQHDACFVVVILFVYAERWIGYMDGAIEAGERAGYEVALNVWERAGATVASGSSDIGTPKPVVPPEAPGDEPMNAKVRNLGSLGRSDSVVIVALVLWAQIGHPKILSPNPVERMLPGKPAAIAVFTIATAAVAAFVFGKTTGRPFSLDALKDAVRGIRARL